ncbi:lipopolysaccharide biosynthesis protein [Paralimibaculum aggregatum]|uniref:Lipopolysaccharide biosynthesis protein n=1 Tax=Paralimibaculum aggregatum TaxID=3036245 RepID=A0ABQ6LIR3_9RHOB|nr:lipopolysaccharide biosynthesis protein [Limibaculum sp. NKW23]GMG83175.1 lipopolysaccharide biosynthesis protein [Limibaculum sp. NKW23]
MSSGEPPEPPPGRAGRQVFETDHLLAGLGRHAARGSLIAVSAQTARMAVQIAAMAILARLLAPADFGLAAMALACTGLLAMFTDLGLSAAAVQRDRLTHSLASALFGCNLAGGLAAMALLIAASPLVGRMFGEPRLVPLMMVLAVVLPLEAAGRQHAALLQRGMRFGALEGTALAAQAVGAAAAVGLALGGAGYWALAAQPLIAAGLGSALLWLACPWRPGRVRDWRGARSALLFGLDMTGFQILNQIHRQVDDLLIGWRWGAVDLGFYNRAYALMMLPIRLLSGPIGAVAIAALSRIKHDPAAWLRLYCRAIGGVMLVAAPVAILLALLAPQIVRLLFGPGWDPASEIFARLSLCILAQPVMSSVGWLWVSRGATRAMLRWAAGSIPLMVLAMLAGLPFGAVGVATGYAVSICLLTPVCLVFAARGLGFGLAPVRRALAPPLAGALAAYLAVRLLLPAAPAEAFGPALLGAGVFVLLYLGFTYALDRRTIRRMAELVSLLRGGGG